MPRPCKPLGAKTAHDTSGEIHARRTVENKLKGSGDLKPPAWLTPSQKKLYKQIVTTMEASGILGCADTYILSEAAVCMERLWCIEQEINAEPGLKYDRDVIASRNAYSKDFFKCCSELSLSPQARAKISVAAVKMVQDNKRNPLLEALLED